MAYNTEKEKMFAIDFESCSRQLYAVAKIHLSNQEDVNDVVQETVLLAYKNYNSLRKKEYFKTWITRILLNEIKKQYRILQKEKTNDYKEVGFDETNRTDNSLLLRSYISKCDFTTQQKILCGLHFSGDCAYSPSPAGFGKNKMLSWPERNKKMIEEDEIHE